MLLALLRNRVLLRVCLAALVGVSAVPAAEASVYASSVEYFDTGTGEDAFQYNEFLPPDPFTALGAPDGKGPSIGETGVLVLGLGGCAIVDGFGPDIIVWGSTNAWAEPGEILASADGVSFVSLGIFGEQLRQKPFDLAGTGLTRASYIKIADLPGGYGLPQGLAFDVDAVEGLYFTVIPEPTGLLVLGSGILALAGIVRRRR